MRSDRGSARIGTVFVLVVLLVLGFVFWGKIRLYIPGFGPDVHEYCQTFKSEGDKLHARWAGEEQQSGNTALGSLIVLGGSIGDLHQFFDTLASHSPDDIRPDVQRLADAYGQLADSYGSGTSVVDGVVVGLAVSMQNAGAEQHVDSYTKTNCAPPIGTGTH